jgi:hypothetical protein
MLPWKWLKVEWDLLDDLFGEVNPWDVLMAVKQSSSNGQTNPTDDNQGMEQVES